MYEQSIRPKVVPGHTGRYLVVDVATGDYEVSDSEYEASRRVLARRPEGEFYSLRIGLPDEHRAAPEDREGRAERMP